MEHCLESFGRQNASVRDRIIAINRATRRRQITQLRFYDRDSTHSLHLHVSQRLIERAVSREILPRARPCIIALRTRSDFEPRFENVSRTEHEIIFPDTSDHFVIRAVQLPTRV